MHVLGSCVVKLLSGAVSKLKRSCGESGGGVGCVSDSRIECFWPAHSQVDVAAITETRHFIVDSMVLVCTV